MSQRTARSFFTIALGSLVAAGSPVLAQEAITLRESFSAGYEYRVSSRVEISGSLSPPVEKGKTPMTLEVKGASTIDYDEKVLKSEGPIVQRTARIYRRIDFQRSVGGKQQDATIRPAVRRLVIMRQGNTEVPFSPDGPLLWGEMDQVRTDVFTPALVGLLADKEVRPGDRWTAGTPAVQELTDMERIDDGHVECRFDQVMTLEKRKYARITFNGTVRGTNEDGPNKQTLDGYLYFDLESNHVSYVYLKGVSGLLDKDGRELGKVEGRFVLSRRAHTQSQELSDEGLKGVTLEPNADNTLLLYDNPDLGIRFTHPRRWRVGGVRGTQLTLDSMDGSGMLLTVDPLARVPSGAQFLTESRRYLTEQKANVLRAEPVQTVRENPPLEHFSLQTEIAGQKVLMDYYVTRQASGGVTLAARLLPTDLIALQLEVERIARSIEVTRK